MALLKITVTDSAIYRYGYISLNGGQWQKIELNGSGLKEDWFAGRATLLYALKPSDLGIVNGSSSENYIIVYSCSKIIAGWDCHGNKWQIEQFNITIAGNISNSSQPQNPIINNTNTTNINTTNTTIPPDTMLLYDFSTGQNANDLSGNLRNGIITNAEYNPAGGPSGKGSLVFNGNDYIAVQDSATGLWREDVISFEIWVKKKYNSTAAEYALAKKDSTGTSYGLYAINNEWKFFVGGWTVSINTPIVYDKWTHIVGSYNRYNSSMTLYIDGKYNGTRKLGWAIPQTNSVDLLIGGTRKTNSTGFVSPFNGEIARVAIYDTYIDAQQAKDLYEKGTYTKNNIVQKRDWKLSAEAGSSSTHQTITQADCDYIIPVSKSGKIPLSDLLGVEGGDTICLEAGRRRGIEFANIHGSPENYIRIVNYGGAVIMDQDNGALTISNSSYINVTGNGHIDHKYGIKNVYASIFGVIFTRSTDFEMSYVEVSTALFAGGSFKTEPSCNLQNNLGYFLQKNANLHHNYVHDTDCEGFYIGHTFQDGFNRTAGCMGTVLYPHALQNTMVHDNIFVRTGCEAIQIAGDPNAKVYNNVIDTAGWMNQTFAVGQTNGIQIGGKMGGDFYNNRIKNIRGAPLIIFAAEDTRIYNNIIEDSGNIYIHSLTSAPNGVRIYNNLFKNVQSRDNQWGTFGIMNNKSFFIIENNIVVQDASRQLVARVWKKENVTERNNLIISSIADAGLDSNYRPLSSSPVIDAGINVSLSFDLDNNPRPVGLYDIGPYEYQE
ncbi:MAG TPA: LamG-like jellyroll fold domain-containing protein [Alphaproteobacteria bacterium]|nr:LamG-like jellyroll fold domain-containing protein [Alphaproteobacteria bacterium]